MTQRPNFYDPSHGSDVMDVLIASTHDRVGGAGIAATRLRDGLLAAGQRVRMLAQTGSMPHPTLVAARGPLQRSASRMRSGIDALPLRRYGAAPDSFSVSWLPRFWPSLADAGPADIVHLHWTNAGFLSVADIGRISGPVVWTLHDMWAFTGGCQYDDSCGRYAQSCGVCPLLRSTHFRDLSQRRFEAKKSHWRDLDLTVVAPSHWMAREAARSPILAGKRIEIIANGLDLACFQPLDRAFARQALGLPVDRRLVLFGALNPGSDARKGYDLLQEAMGHLAQQNGACEATGLIVFGSNPKREEFTHGLPTRHFGHISDDIALALLYAACDVFVAPSKQENLPNTVAEALACGRPVVAFDIGGMPDLIAHGKHGYLAQPFDAAELARGISWCLDAQRHGALCDSARRFACEHLDSTRQTRRTTDLYRELIARARSPR